MPPPNPQDAIALGNRKVGRASARLACAHGWHGHALALRTEAPPVVKASQHSVLRGRHAWEEAVAMCLGQHACQLECAMHWILRGSTVTRRAGELVLVAVAVVLLLLLAVAAAGGKGGLTAPALRPSTKVHCGADRSLGHTRPRSPNLGTGRAVRPTAAWKRPRQPPAAPSMRQHTCQPGR